MDMKYTTPRLEILGSFATLTLGMGGSCTDMGGKNNPNNPDNSTQVGGGIGQGGQTCV